MSFDPKTQSVTRLSFYPRKNWPTLWPVFIWNGVQITPEPTSASIAKPICYPESVSLEELLLQVYPSLSWLEVWQLHRALKQANVPVQSDKLWQLYGYRESSDSDKWESIFAQLHPAVLQWCVDKEMSPKDLAPLKALPDIKMITEELKCLAELQLSKSDGQKALEWIVDLFLMGNTNLPAVMQNVESGTQLLNRLEELRLPLVTQKKRQSEELLKRLSWPRRLQARVSRVGDLSGFEIKFFAQNRDEFVKQVEGLQVVARQLEDNSVERF
jgi:hypothetical protein